MSDEFADRTAGVPRPAARYLSTLEMEAVFVLLREVRESTQSRSHFQLANQLITDLGGVDFVATVAGKTGIAKQYCR